MFPLPHLSFTDREEWTDPGHVSGQKPEGDLSGFPRGFGYVSFDLVYLFMDGIKGGVFASSAISPDNRFASSIWPARNVSFDLFMSVGSFSFISG